MRALRVNVGFMVLFLNSGHKVWPKNSRWKLKGDTKYQHHSKPFALWTKTCRCPKNI